MGSTFQTRLWHNGLLAVWTSYNNKICTSSSTYRNTSESASQFNREYRRFFDQPPIRDTKALREGKVDGDHCRLTVNCAVLQGAACSDRLIGSNPIAQRFVSTDDKSPLHSLWKRHPDPGSMSVNGCFRQSLVCMRRLFVGAASFFFLDRVFHMQ
jgi:hypothetical protein